MPLHQGRERQLGPLAPTGREPLQELSVRQAGAVPTLKSVRRSREVVLPGVGIRGQASLAIVLTHNQ